MLKFVDCKEVFKEIPDEISLAFSLSNCPIRCKNCHSQYLWDDIGTELTIETLKSEIEKHTGISCVLFGGGDRYPSIVNELAKWIKKNTNLKVAWYSGREEICVDERYFDYIKVGPYIEEKGGLDSKNTNQILWEYNHNISDKFYIKKNITNKLQL